MRIKSNYNERITIKSGAVWGIALIILLLLPDDAFSMTALYRSKTLSTISYKWLDYSFSFLLIPFIIKAVSRINKRECFVLAVILLTFTRSIVLFLCGEDNIFTMHSYEVLLTLLSGWSVFKVFLVWRKKYHIYSDARLFEWFCLLHLISQIIGMLFSLSGTGNRFNAIGIDIEVTSFLFAAYIIFEWDNKELKTRLIKIAMFIGLLFTGARIALILLVFILAVKIGINYLSNTRKKHIKSSDVVFIAAVFIVLILVFAFLPQSVFFRVFSTFTRMRNFFADRRGTSLGRINSLYAGMQILKDHYWGLDCSFVILQKYTNIYGYPTFPHSYVLCFRILYGPVVFWGGIIYFLRTTFRRIKKGGVNYATLAFMLLFMVVTGGVMVNYKIVFIYMLVYYLTTTSGSKYSPPAENPL